MNEKFTDIFVRRPVLASVVSLLILLIGLRAYMSLNVRQFPRSDKAVITVQTVYVGAEAELVKGFVTTPLEREIASADGIDYMTSSSVQGVSLIQVHLQLNYPPSEALSQISAKVDKVRSDLPAAAEDPSLDVQVGEATPTAFLSFTSKVMHNNEITDYLNRVVVPELSTISGVQSAEIIGGRQFAMRIWLRPEKLAAYDLTPTDVRRKLLENNYLSAVGKSKGDMVSISLTADTDLHTRQQFEDMVIKQADDGGQVRLSDLGTVVLGGESYDTLANFAGREGPFIGFFVLPTANELSVMKALRAKMPAIQADFPEALDGKIVYDATAYINAAIDEVVFTLSITLAIVTLVIFLFLGSLRTVMIPVVAMPLSLIGAGIIMASLGFSINLLTLLALVLAIGLVVDDAIVVVENIYRHIESGMRPFDAALKGARELAMPVISMSLTLIVVYLPIGFSGGLTGSLFSEFAFTLAGAVFISGMVALTLSPMLCSKLMKPPSTDNRSFAHWLDQRFRKFEAGYERRLHGALDTRPVIYVFAAVVLGSCYFLFTGAQTELAPQEDQGVVFTFSTAAPDATLKQTQLYTKEVEKIYRSFPETKDYFMVHGLANGGTPAGTNSAISGMKLKPWNQRERTEQTLTPLVQAKLNKIAGVQAVAFEGPPLPGSGGGLPVQFVIGTTQTPEKLYPVAREMQKRAQQSGLFVFTQLDLNYDRPQYRISINREKAAQLGVSMQQLGNDLGVMLGGNYVNRFAIQGRSYKVIPQVVRADRYNPDELKNYYTRTKSGEMIPMSSLVSLKSSVQPRQLKRFQQLNAATLSAVPAPGVTLGQALHYLQDQSKAVFPTGYKADYAAQSRQYVAESGNLILTFFFAIIIIYLVLAAQFESFRDPLIILVSVPMSIAGALIFLTLGVATVNIYTQVGLITLIGLIAKHGILIVEFANQLQREQGKSKREAIEMAAGLRLRPILMTTAATVCGVIPLILASGAGAAARFSIGLVIASGMGIGTVFTLFVVPAMYMLLGQDHTQDKLEANPA